MVGCFDHGIEDRDHLVEVQDLEDVPNSGLETGQYQLATPVLGVLPDRDNLSNPTRVNPFYGAQIQDQVWTPLFNLAPNEISESWVFLATEFEHFQLGLFPVSRDAKNRDWPWDSDRDPGVGKAKDPCAHAVDLSLRTSTTPSGGSVGLGLLDLHWMKTNLSRDVTAAEPGDTRH